jgi:hypothetical protein
MNEFLEKWVAPLYLKLSQPDDALPPILRERANEVDEGVVAGLLGEGGSWRERLVGAWLAGLRDWQRFTDEIGGLLLASEYVYAGSGYCFALARFSSDDAATHLERYLDRYLERPDLWYDQNSAMAALRYLDDVRGEARAARFMIPGGPWDRFVANKPSWDLERATQRFLRLMDYYARHFPPQERRRPLDA